MRRASIFGRVRVSVRNGLTFERFDLQSPSLVCGYIFRMVKFVCQGDRVKVKVKVTGAKSVKSHHVRHGQSHCKCSDGKSISVIQDMTLPN